MKSSIKILAMVVLCISFSLVAKAYKGTPPEKAEKRAEKQTNRMTEKLNLNEAQAAKVININLFYAAKMEKAHANNKGDRAAMKEIKTAIRSEKMTEMKTVLTPEQFKSYQSMKPHKKRGKGKKGDCKGKKTSSKDNNKI